MNLYSGSSPFWCRVKEVMCGEMSDKHQDIGDHELADIYAPDEERFSQMDVIKCVDIEDLPDDWKMLAWACIEKYNIKP